MFLIFLSRMHLKFWNAMPCMLTVDREILEHLPSEEQLVLKSYPKYVTQLFTNSTDPFIQAMQLFLKQKGSYKLLGGSMST